MESRKLRKGNNDFEKENQTSNESQEHLKGNLSIFIFFNDF
jgi:hypothetical protein